MLLGATAVPAAAQPPAEPARDLTSAFTPGWLVDDRNGDEVIDFVDARIVIAVSPSPADVAAAANVGARLGWETSALDLGLLDRENGGVTDGELGPGEGAVSVVAMDARFRAGGLRITGGDATGLLAAAAYLSGRYPNLWSVDGDTWSDAAERLRDILIEVDSAAVDSVRVRRIVVDAARPGVSRATLLAALTDTTALREAGTRLAGTARDTAVEPADPEDLRTYHSEPAAELIADWRKERTEAKRAAQSLPRFQAAMDNLLTVRGGANELAPPRARRGRHGAGTATRAARDRRRRVLARARCE